MVLIPSLVVYINEFHLSVHHLIHSQLLPRHLVKKMESSLLTSANSPELIFSLKGRRVFNHKKRSAVKCCQQSYADNGKPIVRGDWRSFRARLIYGEKGVRSEVAPGSFDHDASINFPKVGSKWAHSIHEPERGCLLIATEKLDGVHIFERTVVLLLSTGPVGPTGIILNRQSLMSIKETRSTVLDMTGTFSDSKLFFGGPLEEGLFLLNVKGGDELIATSRVFDEVIKGLYYGTKESIGCAAEMVKRNVVGVDDFRFYDGCCGWEREQLRDEIKAGYWTIAACSPGVIELAGENKCLGLWEEILGLLAPTKVWRKL